ncbi:hypothetical protein IL306_005400 [Fusarium sp. DS 682]|nr:hypothetical protein IL306_005400 [Fusarium sp. DS 682]
MATSSSSAAAAQESNMVESIADGFQDIAKRTDGERMRVEVTGRHPFQKCWLWSHGEEEKTNSGRMKSNYTSYVPATDGPDFASCPKLPTGNELAKDPRFTKEFMEVGIIFGRQPDKFLTDEKSIKPTLKRQQQAARGVHDRDPGAMRVFTPTERVTEDNATAVQPDEMFVEDDVKENATDHRLVATQPEKHENKLDLIWELFRMKLEKTGSRDTSLIHAMARELDSVCMGYKYTREAQAFFTFDSPITEEATAELIRGSTTIDPSLSELTPPLISIVHDALRTVVVKSSGEKLGDRLSQNALVFFLRCCLDITPAKLHPHVVLDEVEVLVRHSQVYSDCTPKISLEQAVSMNTTSGTGYSANFRPVLLSIQSCLEEPVTYTDDGPFLQDTNMDTLMGKLGHAVNVHYVTSLMKQLGALYAVVLAGADQNATLANKEMKHLIDEMLSDLNQDETMD